jgi:hypothetical protein
VVAVLSGAALVAALVVSPGADAQDAPAPASAPVVDAGRATARANVVSVAPISGSLSFAISTGAAVAETQGGLAQSFAQSIDLGLIGTSLTAEGCDGSDPAVPAERLPQPTLADNRNGDASYETQELPLAGNGIGAGLELASATLQPASRAVSTTGDLDLAPLLSLAGGRSIAEAEVFDTTGREARSTVDISFDLAGVLRITGMRWNAHHRTGDEPDAGGSFAMEALEVLGVPVPTESLAGAAQAVNDALASLGLRIELPQVLRLTEPVDLVRVTPLRIVIDDSPAGAAAVRPLLGLTRDIRSDLFEAIVGVYCPSGNTLLAGEIVLGVASGTGALSIDLGGVEAISEDLVVEDPFGVGGTVVPAPVTGVVPLPGAAAGPISPPALGAPLAPVATGGTSAPTPTGDARCETSHPIGSPGCSRGAAGIVGLVGALATAGVGVLDLRRRRKVAAAVASTA